MGKTDMRHLILVSIIVPIYHGEQYIGGLIHQAENNAKNMSCGMELLLVNDDPLVPIDENWYSSSVSVRMIQTEVNRGIHGARVKGLETALGKFVLFLDQDDRITSDYIEKQLEAIGEADAVVCGALQDGRPFYYGDRTLQECIRREYMVQRGNGILSPGQVLLRKDAISAYWRTSILRHNGADDWFLWLCMLQDGKRFVCNPEALFEHTVHGNNTSANDFSMLQSMREVYERLNDHSLYTEDERMGLYNVIWRHETNCMRERDKFLELYVLLDDWMELRERGVCLGDYFRAQGERVVCIYGKGRVGLRLAKELQTQGIQVRCFIDQKAEIMDEGIQTVRPEKFKHVWEPVIITLARADAKAVCSLLKEQGVSRLYLLSDIIREYKEHGQLRIEDEK
ncbi:MAG: glycosyltransferase [Hespellia sp.]|nr:glycosyltransferase [Hespellia sp.]